MIFNHYLVAQKIKYKKVKAVFNLMLLLWVSSLIATHFGQILSYFLDWEDRFRFLVLNNSNGTHMVTLCWVAICILLLSFTTFFTASWVASLRSAFAVVSIFGHLRNCTFYFYRASLVFDISMPLGFHPISWASWSNYGSTIVLVIYFINAVQSFFYFWQLHFKTDLWVMT